MHDIQQHNLKKFSQIHPYYYCDCYKKRIVIDETEEDVLQRSVFRHELTHAFLFECGLRNFAQDEMLVDFISSQNEKLHRLFCDLEI